MNSPVQITVYENQGVTFLARLRTNSGAYITQAIFGTITYNVYNLESASTVSLSGSFVVASTVFDTLQTTDARWTVDSTGYNFAGYIAASAFPAGDVTYQAEIKFTPTGSDPFHLVGQVQTENLLTGS